MRNNGTQLIDKLKSNPATSFQEVIAFIDENYHFNPTAFQNGNQHNKVGENNGSCKVFSFAKIQEFSKEETLRLFGDYYQEVLNTPQAIDHQNIRNFMQFGWNGITFEGVALELI